MTTHDQHQEATQFTTAPADFTDGQGGTPPPAAAPTSDGGPTPPAEAARDTYATDQLRSAQSVPPADGIQNQTQTHAQSDAVQSDTAHTDAAHTDAVASDDALFADHDLSDLRSRWNEVQATFVDDPRDCVQKADGLVSDAVEQLTSSFAHARSRLEEQWSRGEEASTEDLRLALKRYRDFFDRLLAV